MHTNLSHLAALRRHTRLPARIPVRLKFRGMSMDSVTTNISLSGAFILCDVVGVSAGERLHVRFWLPDSLEHVTLAATVTRVERDGMSGCGVMFEGGGLEAIERWEDFVERLMQVSPSSEVWRMAQEVEHTWHGLSMETLESLLDVDIFMGGIFVKTQAECEVGTRVRLMLVHPVDHSRLRVNARVTGCRRHGEPGWCLEFSEPIAVLRMRLRSFIDEGLPRLEFDDRLMRRATQELLRVS